MQKVVGRSYGNSTVKSIKNFRVAKNGSVKYRYILECRCGCVFDVEYANLQKAKEPCPNCRQKARAASKAHHPLKLVWQGIVHRCTVPTCAGWPYYGGRGITVCPQWLGATAEHTATVAGFWQFVEDIGPRPSPQHTVGRINNDGPYSPENCEWQTSAQQANNKRTSVFATVAGRTQTLAQWANELGIGSPRLYSAAKVLGVSPETMIERLLALSPEERKKQQRWRAPAASGAPMSHEDISALDNALNVLLFDVHDII